MKDKRTKRDMHGLDENGMVLCNPRDKEASHRALMEGIATDVLSKITCRKCIPLAHKQIRDRVRKITGPHEF